ncbi:MAG: response regulator [Cyclobacteriaceae bacterium]|nr:response regulator [Cyclobacteriaceae bacterium]MCH8515066.1 response regulator [Cyclobacteriaceae bacterium]
MDAPALPKVCIIDDDFLFVKLTKLLLEKSNFCSNVEIFKNGQEALQHFSSTDKWDTNIIFLDLNMPELDGWGFLQRYREIRPQSPPIIYIVSSSIDPKDKARANDDPLIEGFLSKPLKMDTLKSISNSFINSQST